MSQRSYIKLAAGPYERLKNLKNTSQPILDREVLISKDTNELFVGTGDGNYHILSNTLIGETLSDLNSKDPLEGRYFFNSSNHFLYFGTGNGWKRIKTETELLEKSGLNFSSGGKLSINTDNVTIVINDSNQLEVMGLDCGTL